MKFITLSMTELILLKTMSSFKQGLFRNFKQGLFGNFFVVCVVDLYKAVLYAASRNLSSSKGFSVTILAALIYLCVGCTLWSSKAMKAQ